MLGGLARWPVALGPTPFSLAAQPAKVAFVDAAPAAGILFQHDNAATAEKYLIETMGAGCGWIDYDQNGLFDLYLVNSAATKAYNPRKPLRSALYRNNGDGTFTDVTEKAGVAAPGWASSAVWFDYDNDGKLDLFVCRFVEFDKSKNKFCGNEKTKERYYCIPRVYTPARCWLFRNNGTVDASGAHDILRPCASLARSPS